MQLLQGKQAYIQQLEDEASAKRQKAKIQNQYQFFDVPQRAGRMRKKSTLDITSAKSQQFVSEKVSNIYLGSSSSPPEFDQDQEQDQD